MSKLSRLGEILNGESIPKERGVYPAYGGNGVISYVNKYNYPENTIVIGRVGANCGAVHFSKSKCWVTDNALAFNVNDSTDAYFAYCLLNKIELNRFHIGSSQPLITQSIINNIEFDYIEEKKKQVEIATCIKTFDDKIANNNAINVELEAIAKIIYDYWFLQFDFPNKEGKPYKSSGGKMVWSEELKREIPEGWKVKQLRNYVDVIRGVSYDKKDVLMEPKEGYVPLLKANNIQNGVISYDNLVYVKKEKVSNEQMLTKNSILITMSSGSKEHMGKTAVIYETIPYTCGAFCANIKCLPEYRGFLALYFRHSLFKNNIAQMSIGTNINNINNEHIYEMKIPVPPKRILKQYEDIVSIILDKQGQISKENQELICLRDFLLPLLMNGQVRCVVE